jgi:hypothetical protein
VGPLQGRHHHRFDLLWLLGPLGAILAIPLTLLAKALLVDIDPNGQPSRGRRRPAAVTTPKLRLSRWSRRSEMTASSRRISAVAWVSSTTSRRWPVSPMPVPPHRGGTVFPGPAYV